MKKFLEDYGLAILAAVIAIVIMTASGPVSENIKIQVSNTIKKMSSLADRELGKVSTLGLKANQVIDVNGDKLVIIKSEGYSKYLVMDTEAKGKYSFDKSQTGPHCWINDNEWDLSGCVPKYENSDIDRYLENEYYNSLSYKDAIVPVNIKQNSIEVKHNTDRFRWFAKDYEQGPGWYIKVNDKWIVSHRVKPQKGISGGVEFTGKGVYWNDLERTYSRKVFLPSLDEISHFSNINDQYDMELLSSIRRNEGKGIIWTRDFRKSEWGENQVIVVNYASKSIDCQSSIAEYWFKPAFVIDLDKVEWTLENELYIK